MKTNQAFCPSCNSEKSITKFDYGVGVNTNKLLPYCKECCEIKLSKYNALTGNIDAGMWILCGELCIPFLKNVWLDTKEYTERKRNKNYVTEYLGALRTNGELYQGFWESDTMLDEILVKKPQSEINAHDLEAMKKKWGLYEDYNEAYPFLEEAFEEYTYGLNDLDANLIRRYKDLCIAEYAKRKAQESGDAQKIGKAQDNVTSLLKLLKLDNFQENKQSEEEKRIERMAWIIENTRPAECEDLEKYKDVNGFESTWNHLERCLKNLVAGTKDYPNVPKDIG